MIRRCIWTENYRTHNEERKSDLPEKSKSFDSPVTLTDQTFAQAKIFCWQLQQA